MECDVVKFCLCRQSCGKTSDNAVKFERNGQEFRRYINAEDRIGSGLSMSFVDLHIVVA